MAATSTVSPALGPAALFYAQKLGFPVFPLHSVKNGVCSCGKPSCDTNAGKHPRTPHGFKDASLEESEIDSWWQRWPDANIGIPTGKISGLIVLDIDPRNGGNDSLDALLEIHGPLPDTVHSITGGGGDHYLFKHPGGIKSGALAKGIDIKADGGYIVAPPSTHRSGRSYVWELSSRPGEVEVASIPDWILKRLDPKNIAIPTGPPGELEGSFLYRSFESAGWLSKRIDATKVAVQCPWDDEHTSGERGDSSTVLFAPSEGKTLGYFHCSHSHCSDRTNDDAMRALPMEAILAAKRAELDDLIAAFRRDPNQNIGTIPDLPTGWDDGLSDHVPSTSQELQDAWDEPPETIPPSAENTSDKQWMSNLVRMRNGDIGNSYLNVALIIRHVYGPRLKFNEMKVSPVLDNEMLSDSHIGSVREEIEKEFMFAPAKEHVIDAIVQISHERPYHPVRRYLTSLEWDGQPRIDRVANEIIGTDEENPDLTHRMIRNWFVSAVARAIRPGCKVDTVLILVGPQGHKKSTFFDVLGGEFFADTHMDIQKKDGLMQLSSAWIYEWSELESITSRKQVADVKSFTTSRSDTFRPPWGRGIIQHPRSSVIVGTTNEDQFLQDMTGSRRFWILRVKQRINVDLLCKWRDQLWAEAKFMLEHGHIWWLEDQDEAVREKEARVHLVDDAWEQLIKQWLDLREKLRHERKTMGRPLPEDEEEKDYYTVGDILSGALNIESAKWGRSEQTRVGICMTRIGWIKHRPRIDGVRTWVYRKSPKTLS